MTRLDFTDLSRAALRDWLLQEGEVPYRAEQILRWVYVAGASDFETMSNVPRGLRARLAQAFTIPATEPAAVATAADGTRKLLFRLDGNAPVESVLIPDPPRLTLCVSSQAGCGMGCAFCATARMGLRRNRFRHIQQGRHKPRRPIIDVLPRAPAPCRKIS